MIIPRSDLKQIKHDVIDLNIPLSSYSAPIGESPNGGNVELSVRGKTVNYGFGEFKVFQYLKSLLQSNGTVKVNDFVRTGIEKTTLDRLVSDRILFQSPEGIIKSGPNYAEARVVRETRYNQTTKLF